MAQYAARRLLLAIPTVLIILTLTFILIRQAPGDPAQAYIEEGGGAAALEAARERLGLHEPIHIQYARYVALMAQGDLGRSLISGRPVVHLLQARYPFTLQLAVVSLLIALAIALPLGILAAIRHNTLLDRLVTVSAVLAYSMPTFWLAMLFVLLFGVTLGWFPVIGAGELGNPASMLRHLALPALTMGLSEAAFLTRMTRSTVIEELKKDYIRTARARGASEPRVIVKHVLRNALIPVATVVGFSVASLISGSIVIETIFVRPGVGQLLLEGINQRDYSVVQGGIVTFAIGIIVINLLVDLSYGLLDPRIRYD